MWNERKYQEELSTNYNYDKLIVNQSSKIESNFNDISLKNNNFEINTDVDSSSVAKIEKQNIFHKIKSIVKKVIKKGG